MSRKIRIIPRTKEQLHEMFEYRDGTLYNKTNRSSHVRIGDEVAYKNDQ